MRSPAEVLDRPSSGAASSGPRFPIARATPPARQPCTMVVTSTRSAKPIIAGTDQGQGQVAPPVCSETSGRVQTARPARRPTARGRGSARSAARWLRDFTGHSSQSQGPSGGPTVAADFSELKKLVHGELVLVGYRDGGPIFETVGGSKS